MMLRRGNQTKLKHELQNDRTLINKRYKHKRIIVRTGSGKKIKITGKIKTVKTLNWGNHPNIDTRITERRKIIKKR